MIGEITLPADWEPRVRPAIAAALPDLREAGLRPLGAGLESVALLLDESYVLRFPQHDDAAASVRRESKLLPLLYRDLPVEIPRFTFLAPNPLGPGLFCGYPLVRGESLAPDEWHARGLTSQPNPVRQIAAILDAIHAFPIDKARSFGVPEWDLRADFTETLEHLPADVLPLLTPAEATKLLTTWERYLGEDANFAEPHTFIHGDVSLDHLLITGDEITGMIDFGDSEIADPDYDLAYLWTGAGEDFVRRIQEHRGRPLTETQASKLAFWALADPVDDLLHAIESDTPWLYQHALTTLHARLATE